MKFTLIATIVAVVSAVNITKSGVSDESYESNFDNRKASISNTHKNAEATRTSDVNAQEASDKWRGVKDPSIFGV